MRLMRQCSAELLIQRAISNPKRLLSGDAATGFRLLSGDAATGFRLLSGTQ